MSVPFPGSAPFDDSVHFDLGTDRLASPMEIEESEDPWTPTDATVPDPVMPHPLSMPGNELGEWAGDMQLPGL